MARETGHYRVTKAHGEEVRAFVPNPLPPVDPPLDLSGRLAEVHTEAASAIGRLGVAAGLVPDVDHSIYGFVRREAVLSSRIEGTQATLRDLATFEANRQADDPDDVREVTNYVRAIEYARREIAKPDGLPLSARLICETHRLLMEGSRGEHQSPGEVRTSQNWIAGTRPGNAKFVPPPPDEVGPALGALMTWIHADDPLPPLVRAGLAHVQFETIHPFLDGNGRLGRLLITLLVEKWGLLDQPLLYVSLEIKRRQAEYYTCLSQVRSMGRWEQWTQFFLECVRDAAINAVEVAGRINAMTMANRRRLLDGDLATLNAVRLFETLPEHPVMTLSRACELLGVTKATAGKAIESLEQAGILAETTGMQRDRVYAYREYLDVLSEDETT